MIIRVLTEDNQVLRIEYREYLRAVVPAEMPAEWPLDALMAQAVAAGSYALYAVAHGGRHAPDADVCAGVHCQVYNPGAIHPRSDEAVEDIMDLVAVYDGRIANLVYHAACGGHTRNNEDIWKGAPMPYMRGVVCPCGREQNGHGVGLCQYGAREFAKKGNAWDAILRYYYRGIEFVPLGKVMPDLQNEADL